MYIIEIGDQMKKIIKSRIFLIVICGIIFTGLGVYATTIYKASDVVYNASDGSSMNVNDALNELYNNRDKLTNFNLTQIATASTGISGSADKVFLTKTLEQGKYFILFSAATTEYSALSNVTGCSSITKIDRISVWHEGNGYNETNSHKAGRGSSAAEIYICIVENSSTITVSEYMEYGTFYGRAVAAIYKIE